MVHFEDRSKRTFNRLDPNNIGGNGNNGGKDNNSTDDTPKYKFVEQHWDKKTGHTMVFTKENDELANGDPNNMGGNGGKDNGENILNGKQVPEIDTITKSELEEAGVKFDGDNIAYPHNTYDKAMEKMEAYNKLDVKEANQSETSTVEKRVTELLRGAIKQPDSVDLSKNMFQDITEEKPTKSKAEVEQSTESLDVPGNEIPSSIQADVAKANETNSAQTINNTQSKKM
ncbi:MAG: hypothetical protein K6C40_08235 [Thermoguttaceae bacterium]|nr:hypothetical protein [Thermoguttaceae bacterium]